MATFDHEESLSLGLNTTLRVMQMLELIHPSTSLNSGAIAPIPTAYCLSCQQSCESERIVIFAIHKNYLANYVQKLQ